MHSLQIIRPQSLSEALAFLHEAQNTFRILGGGTDLLVSLRNLKTNNPGFEGLLDLSDLNELRVLEVAGDHFHVGSMITFTDLHHSPLVRREVPLLAEMARWMGSPQIRNRATVGGNIASAATCADSLPPLLVLSARVFLSSLSETRSLSLDEFILDSGHTAIRSDEILTGITFDRLPESTAWVYRKLGRRKSAAISRISVAALRTATQGRQDFTCRLAVGAVTSKPMRLRQAEQCLSCNEWGRESISPAAIAARAEVASITGNRWSSAYKLPVLENLVRKALIDLDL